MKHFRDSLQKPHGQVLLATLLFCFIFVSLFIGLYKVGLVYNFKERARRSADLTLLSGGAVYANGLRLVQYSNVVLMLSYAVDIGVIATEIVGFIATFPESIPLAIEAGKKADPNIRKYVHQIQSFIFGVELPSEDESGNPDTDNSGNSPPLTLSGFSISVYGILIALQGHATAEDNHLENNLLTPAFFFNIETCENSLKKMVVPNMSLRFRKVSELLPAEEDNQYSLLHDGVRRYYNSSQVEPAENPRHPKQMRVKRGFDQFGGRWVRREKSNDSDSPSDESNHIGGGIAAGAWKKLLHGLLDHMVLDITHETDPPIHTLVMWSRLTGKNGIEPTTFNELNEVTLEGGGLAAWDILDPPFKVYLKKAEIDDFPILGKITQGIPSTRNNVSDALRELNGIWGGI